MCLTPTSLHEILELGIVGTGADAFPAAEVPDGSVPAKSFKDDADLLLCSELATGNTFDTSYELLRFLSPDFSLPELFGYSLGHGPTPSLVVTLLLPESRSKPLKCPLTYVFNVSHFP